VSGRSEALVVFVVCASVLAGSWLLIPNAAGTGLVNGLPYRVCLFRAVTHLPCPFCGMTTAFALMARGRVVQAARENVLGPVAYAITCIGLAAGLYGIITKRGVIPAWLGRPEAVKVIAGIIVAAWAVNIYIYLSQP